MNRLKKEDYMSDEAVKLQEELKSKLKEDKYKAQAERIVANMRDVYKPYVLEILSRQFAAK